MFGLVMIEGMTLSGHLSNINEILQVKKIITYPIYLGPPLPKPLGGHHMVPFGENAIAVIGGQSSNLTIQDEIHVFRRVLLL